MGSIKKLKLTEKYKEKNSTFKYLMQKEEEIFLR